MHFQEFTEKTGITEGDVEQLCQTPTNEIGKTTLTEWLEDGDYDGDETAESLAAEWDEASE